MSMVQPPGQFAGSSVSQLLKRDAEPSAAFRFTTVPAVNVAEQVPPVGRQSMPAGIEVTLDCGLPFGSSTKTVSVYVGIVNPADTLAAAVIVTTQLPVPLHAPDQPVKVELPVGVAVRVTTVPWVKVSEQSVPQEMPAGLEVIVPVPVPVLLTLKV